MNQVLRDAAMPSGARLQLVQGDITLETVDAIVNAANNRLQHGGGVARVIARAAGPVLQRESDRWVQEHGPVDHAEPAVTSAGQMLCRYVIHAVGPVWGSGDEDRKLAEAVSGSLRVADGLGLEAIALPALSTGIFGFPKERAARVILAAIWEYLENVQESRLAKVRLVLFDPPSVEAFLEIFDTLLPDSEVGRP